MGVNALFLDSRKAFDMVDHRKLAELNINKRFSVLKVSYIAGVNRLNWIRFCRLYCHDLQALIYEGPTLFSAHINDIEDSIPNSIAVDTYKYPDDWTLDESLKQDVICRGLNSVQIWVWS